MMRLSDSEVRKGLGKFEVIYFLCTSICHTTYMRISIYPTV